VIDPATGAMYASTCCTCAPRPRARCSRA
jgi:hypothetical protein